MKKIITGMLLAIFCGALISGCASEAEKISYEKVCDESNNGKRSAIEGYFWIKSDLTPNNLKQYTVNVCEKPLGEGKCHTVYISANHLLGNSLKVGEFGTKQFVIEDVKLITNDRNEATHKDKVKVSGTVELSPIVLNGKKSCWLNSPRIDLVKN